MLRSSDLKVNESALTGESDDIVKHEGSAPVLLAGSQVGGSSRPSVAVRPPCPFIPTPTAAAFLFCLPCRWPLGLLASW